MMHKNLALLSPLTLFAAFPLWGSTAATQEAAAQEDATQSGLRRVDAPLGTPQGSTSVVFDPDEWLQLLEERDLDRREKHFERLVQRARKDDAAREFLEELAEATQTPDLAWTARLALRELRTRRGLGVAPMGEFFGRAPGGALEELFPDFQVFQLDPDRLFPPGTQSWIPSPGVFGGSGQSRSVQVEETEDGCTVRIQENVDGEEVNREYTGESYEAILEANPELRDELADSRMGMRIQMGTGDLDMDDFLRFDFGGSKEGRPRFYISKRGLSPQPMRTDILGVRVRPLSPEAAERMGLEETFGMVVDSVFPRTIAHALNLRSGDVILSVAGTRVKSAGDITRALRDHDSSTGIRVEWIDPAGERHDEQWIDKRSSEPRDQADESTSERKDF